MKLYWFSDEEGARWEIIAANTEQKAWELFASAIYKYDPHAPNTPAELVAKAQEKFELNAITDVSEGEGIVAVIFPREVNFTIRKSPGSKELGHLRNI